MEDYAYNSYMRSLNAIKETEDEFVYKTTDTVNEEYTYNLKALKEALQKVPTLSHTKVKVRQHVDRIDIKVRARIRFSYDVRDDDDYDNEYSNALYEAKTGIENALYEWTMNENNFTKK